MTTASQRSPVSGAIDYNLHNLVGIRLIDAGPQEATAVTRQLGPIRAAWGGEPDVVIRFVDRVPTSSPLRAIGVDEAGFTDDAFLVLRSKHKTRARVQIPLDRIGRRCEIVCERGIAAVPLLIPIVNLTMLGKGILPMHASAFTYRGTGILVTGWSKGGKTETLLGFLANGAEYVGDEWIYLTADGRRMLGIPEPIRVWDWHLDDLPKFRALLRRSERVRMQALRLAVGSLRRTVAVGRRCGLSSLKGLSPLAKWLERQQFVHIPPAKFSRRGMGSLAGSPDKIFFVASHELSEVTVRPSDPQEIARRMVFSLQQERAGLMSYYRMFRFAFPDVRNPLLDRAGELERKILTQAFQDKEAYSVYHPYPIAIPLLFDAIHPFCGRKISPRKLAGNAVPGVQPAGHDQQARGDRHLLPDAATQTTSLTTSTHGAVS